MSLPYIQVQTTTASIKEAKTVAKELIKQRLVACVQITECSSLYRWKGAVAEDKEFLCTMKTRKDLFDTIKKKIAQIHPYDVPELVAIPITECAESYKLWLDEELLSKG